MEILWKSVVGGLLTGCIVWLSKRGSVLPGVLPLFPTFAVIALLVVGMEGNQGNLKEVCVSGLKTLPGYLVFLLVFYAAMTKLDYRLAVLLAVAGWLLAVLAMFRVFPVR
jgi:uncharacterized membrane protein (GlpM family)